MQSVLKFIVNSEGKKLSKSVLKMVAVNFWFDGQQPVDLLTV